MDNDRQQLTRSSCTATLDRRRGESARKSEMDRPFGELERRVVEFREERDWTRFHNPKDLAISIALEAGELLELFQWKDPDETAEVARSESGRGAMAAEMADILILLLSAADATGIDLYAATLAKIEQNARKYPVEKAKGNARKYTELE
jgi:NTP pyrophosphatase (non-canonical NTP hydrolase)